MKQTILLYLLLCLFIGNVSAQTKDTIYQFSLRQAVEYAYTHQDAMLNAVLDEQTSDARVKEIRGQGMPQINASAGVQDYVKIPVTVVPGSFFPASGLPADALIPFSFGTRYTSSAGINVSQLLIDPTYFIALQANQSIHALAQKSITRTRIETAVSVSKAYYAVLVNTARLQLINPNVERLKKLASDTKAEFDNGSAEKIDVDRVTLTYNNAVTEKENTERMMELSNYLLKYQMGMNIYAKLNLMDSLNAEQVKNMAISNEQPDVTKRIEYSILQTNKRLHYLDMKRDQVGYIPSLSLVGSINTLAYRNDEDILSSGQTWYPNGYLGASLTWTLFDGLQKHYRAQQARFAMQQTENDITNLENGLNLEVNTSKTTLQNALASLKTQENNLNLANEVSSVAKIKFDQGVGSNLEVIDAETSLKEARTNYYNALYDALVAKVDLDKSLGNIK